MPNTRTLTLHPRTKSRSATTSTLPGGWATTPIEERNRIIKELIIQSTLDEDSRHRQAINGLLKKMPGDLSIKPDEKPQDGIARMYADASDDTQKQTRAR